MSSEKASMSAPRALPLLSGCSALRDGGFRCNHGHAVTMGCRTNPNGDKTPGPYGNVPLCLRDDYEFDEEKQTVTRSKWRG